MCSASSVSSPPISDERGRGAGIAADGRAELREPHHLAVVDRHEARPGPSGSPGAAGAAASPRRRPRSRRTSSAGRTASAPRGTSWRIASVFDCCCTMRFGHIVCITTVAAPGNSRTGSSSRGSLQRRGRRGTTACRRSPRLAGCSPRSRRARSAGRSRPSRCADGLSARNRPKVTRNTCSRLAWYGSLMFSNISFQFAGTPLAHVAEHARARDRRRRGRTSRASSAPRYSSSGSAACAERREDHTVALGDRERRQSRGRASSKSSGIPPCRAPSRPLTPLRNGTATRSTVEVVDPLVVRAHELVGVAARRPAELHAPVRAAVDERAQRAVRLRARRRRDARRPRCG